MVSPLDVASVICGWSMFEGVEGMVWGVVVFFPLKTIKLHWGFFKVLNFPVFEVFSVKKK